MVVTNNGNLWHSLGCKSIYFELTCQDFPFTQMMGGDHSLSKINTWKEDVCNIICLDRHKRMQQDMPSEITKIFSKKTA